MQEVVIKIGNKELYGKDQLMGVVVFDQMVLQKHSDYTRKELVKN